MKISELKNGQIVRYRIGIAGRERIEWDSWKTGPIFVQIREKAYRKLKAGVVVIAVPEREVSPEHDYNPPHDDYTNNGENYPSGYFMSEEYCLEIAGIEPGWEF